MGITCIERDRFIERCHCFCILSEVKEGISFAIPCIGIILVHEEGSIKCTKRLIVFSLINELETLVDFLIEHPHFSHLCWCIARVDGKCFIKGFQSLMRFPECKKNFSLALPCVGIIGIKGDCFLGRFHCFTGLIEI